MAQNNINPNNNRKKADEIVELWYRATGEKFGKVNLATNEEVETAKLAGKKEYIQAVKDKAIPVVYETPLVLRKDQNLHVVFYSNTHYYDLNNQQKGIDNNTYKVAFKQDLQNKVKEDKTVVLFTGNFFGKEWKMGNLNTAHINEDKKILFWGVKNRVNAFIQDIIFAAKNGADEILLMNGREEHEIKQKLNIDIEKEAIMDRFNELLFKYAIEVVKRNNTVNKNVKIAYVPGVKKVFNVVKTNSENKKIYFNFSVHTNTKTNSDDLKTIVKAADKQHAGLAQSDAVFIQAENNFGYDSALNAYVVSGQSTYNSTSRGNLPGYAPKGRSSCTLLLGDTSHDLQVVFGSMNFVNEDLYPAQKRLAKERVVEEFYLNAIQEKLNEKHQQFVSSQNDISNFKEKGE